MLLPKKFDVTAVRAIDMLYTWMRAFCTRRVEPGLHGEMDYVQQVALGRPNGTRDYSAKPASDADVVQKCDEISKGLLKSVESNKPPGPSNDVFRGKVELNVISRV